MKTIIYFTVLVCGFLFIGCENVDEKPPMKGSSGVSLYTLPIAPVLTDKDWQEVQAQRDEYEASLKL